jgi:tripartite-type tricarboxylate transporter receptor subunit TctC
MPTRTLPIPADPFAARALGKTSCGMRRLLTVVATAVLSIAPLSSQAQDAYPSSPVRIVVPYPPGGTADILGRVVAERLAAAWGSPVVVDNRAGAGGAIGVEAVANSKPDGYSLVLGVTGALTIAPHLRKLPYDPIKDLAPISLVGASPSMLAVHPSLPVSSVDELIKYAKANPGKVGFSSAGVGTSVHIASELFKSMAGIEIFHVPYKGGTPSVQGLLGGEVQMTIENIPSLQPHVKSGKVKGLAVTSPGRSAIAPDLPPISDTLPGYQVTTWFGLFAPAGTPEAVIRKVHATVAEALEPQAVRDRLTGLGIEAIAGTPQALAEHLKTESEKFGKVIKDAGIKVE